MTTTMQQPVIAGLGMTEIGKIYGKSVTDFSREAVQLAVADAGLKLSDIDGLIVHGGVAGSPGVELQRDLNLRDLSLLAELKTWGTNAAVMIQYAAMAVQTGQATTVVCVFADAPLRQPGGVGEQFAAANPKVSGWSGIKYATGIRSGPELIAMNTRRHMLKYGTTSEQLGHIAVAQREWALLNPTAQMTKPITLEDHQESRMIADPLRLLDCCLVSNGGIAVIVTTAGRAKDLAQPPVKMLGWSQQNPGFYEHADPDFGLVSGATVAGPKALGMAGLTVEDVDVVQFYDCFTWTVLVTLEDYGFCGKGEGGDFVSSGVLGPYGTFPMNTGGGQLSSFYLQGSTPVSEGIIQARGQAGARQVEKHDVVLVSNNGGSLDHHATLVLGSADT